MSSDVKKEAAVAVVKHGVRLPREEYHRRPVVWGVPDFIGKFHLNRMTTSTPIPGTAIRVEQERNAFMEKRASSMQAALDSIEERRRLRVMSKTRKAAITARVQVQATVGYRMDAVQRMYQKATSSKKQRLSVTRYPPDDDFTHFLGHVETNNIYQVQARLREKHDSLRLVATAEARYGNTPLHRAVSLGFVEMSRILLETGADPDEVNTTGDASIHCCWNFWRSDTSKYFLWVKNPYLMTTRQQKEDFVRMERDVKATVALLRLLTRGGADVDQRRNNGEVALHTAARRGPLQAIWVLLLSKATHDVVDRRMFTPEGAAARARNAEFVALLANWPVARRKYFDSEFVQEWMRFLCDPDANLENDLTASEVMAQVRMEAHEESTAVRARGGHLLVDEVITGPVLSSEEKARAQMVAFSAEAVSLTSTLENSGNYSSSTSTPWTEETSNSKASKRGGAGGRGRAGDDGGCTDIDDSGNKDTQSSKKTKSKLGKELDVFLAQARDETAGARVGGTGRALTAYCRLVAKAQLEGRKGRWPGGRDNGKPLSVVGGGPPGADPFGRPMTTNQRRRIAALEIAEDGGVEGPLLRPATSSMLLTTKSRAAKKGTTPHPYFGRRLLTQRLLNQREREASIKPTATIGLHQQGDDAGAEKSGAVYLNETRSAFHDTNLLPGPKDPGMCIDRPGRLHALHPVMQRRKLHERPYCELQGNRKHNENVYGSTLGDYCPNAWNTAAAQEPLLPVRRKGP